MKKIALAFVGFGACALLPDIAGAAGTYYNGAMYQSPQRYGSNAGGYYNTYGAGRGYGQNQMMMNRNVATNQVAQKSNAKQATSAKKQGLRLTGAITHEFANWDIEMANAKSKLRYDGVAWNVISGDGVYYFDTSTPVQLNFGARYGKQYGETSMIDDDISRGGYGQELVGNIGVATGYAMSVGTSKDGTQVGFNAAVGLTDFFSVGRAKLTPSLGYRYFKHKLVTKDNSGLTMDVFNGDSSHPYVNCIEVDGELQCDAYVAFIGETTLYFTGRLEEAVGTQTFLTDYIVAPGGVSIYGVDLGDTYYYHQAGTSHDYETEWAGPYVALDMEYVINNNNTVNAGIEFGLPLYDSKGDQPYRVDWAHPTSVEDKGGFGDAYHFGMNAMWSTSVTDSVMLSLGMTYDYYNAKKADTTTYFNQTYYNNVVSSLQASVDYLVAQGAEAATIAAYQTKLTNAQADVNYLNSVGWKLESKDEVKSVYSAMGIRLGLNVKF